MAASSPIRRPPQWRLRLALGLSAVAALIGLLLSSLVGRATASTQTSLFVALGDSYASGQGLGPYEPRSGTCFVSQHDAYPELLLAEIRHRIVACSGANVADLYHPYRGQPAQLDALNRSTGYVTVTVGGNDLSFASTLSACLSYDIRVTVLGVGGDLHGTFQPAKCRQLLGALPARLEATAGQLSTLYATILRRAPNAQVRVVDYPVLFPQISSAAAVACPVAETPPLDLAIGPVVVEVRPSLGYPVSTLATFNDAAVAVDQAMAAAVVQLHNPRLRLVDVRAAFADHAAGCGRTGVTPWINGLTVRLPVTTVPGTLAQLRNDLAEAAHPDLLGESFHPTVAGQQAIAAATSASWSTATP
jgi:lysophospholipase L1-like esterase